MKYKEKFHYFNFKKTFITLHYDFDNLLKHIIIDLIIYSFN